MTLQELYGVCPEGLAIRVYGYESDEEVACYDGRDSIPESFNERRVEVVCPLSAYELGVWVEE